MIAPFPASSGVLDYFARPDGALGANWGSVDASPQPVIAGGAAVWAGSASRAAWAARMVPATAVYATVAALPTTSTGGSVEITDPVSGQEYLVTIAFFSSPPYGLAVLAGGSATAPFSPAVGDGIALSYDWTIDLVTGWHRPVGASWINIASATGNGLGAGQEWLAGIKLGDAGVKFSSFGAQTLPDASGQFVTRHGGRGAGW